MKTLLPLLWTLLATNCLCADEPPIKWAESLSFHISFDKSAQADYAKGDPQVYTAATLERKQQKPGLHVPGVMIEPGRGRWGSALRFTRKTDQVVLYKAAKNLLYRERGFQGTISCWLSLDPEADLEPGYVDPIQITDKKWNDAAFFVDFTKDDHPRHFRLGVFSDYAVWNPTDRKWEEIPVQQRPMVDVANPRFGRDRWTHVAWTFADFNNEDKPGVAKFYLDGQLQGEIVGIQRITWQPDNVAIMLGISYIGLMDDFAVFDVALTPDEIAELGQLKDGIKSLRR